MDNFSSYETAITVHIFVIRDFQLSLCTVR